ncbi:MAG TPA: hypothetical protein DEA55_02320 [Rhodospirillaceae bacterium]|nr:hypothetical protein [Rhodospirillaceae bacterium]
MSKFSDNQHAVRNAKSAAGFTALGLAFSGACAGVLYAASDTEFAQSVSRLKEFEQVAVLLGSLAITAIGAGGSFFMAGKKAHRSYLHATSQIEYRGRPTSDIG